MRYKIKESILISSHDEGGIVLDTKSGIYHELNVTAIKILEFIESGDDLELIVNKIISQYDIDEKNAKKNILNFIKNLIKNDFIQEN